MATTSIFCRKLSAKRVRVRVEPEKGQSFEVVVGFGKVTFASGAVLTVSEPGRKRSGIHLSLALPGTKVNRTKVLTDKSVKLTVQGTSRVPAAYRVWNGVRQIHSGAQLIVVSKGTELVVPGARPEAREHRRASSTSFAKRWSLFQDDGDGSGMVVTQYYQEDLSYGQLWMVWEDAEEQEVAEFMLKEIISFGNGVGRITLTPEESLEFVRAIRSRSAAEDWVEKYRKELRPLFANEDVFVRCPLWDHVKCQALHYLLQKWGFALVRSYLTKRLASYLSCFDLPATWRNDGRSWHKRLELAPRNPDGIYRHLRVYYDLHVILRGDDQWIWVRRKNSKDRYWALWDSTRMDLDQPIYCPYPYEGLRTLQDRVTHRELGLGGKQGLVKRLVKSRVKTDQAIPYLPETEVVERKSTGLERASLKIKWDNEQVSVSQRGCALRSDDPSYIVHWMHSGIGGKERLGKNLRVLSGHRRMEGGLCEIIAVLTDSAPCAILRENFLVFKIADGQSQSLRLLIRDNFGNRYVVGVKAKRVGNELRFKRDGKLGSYQVHFQGSWMLSCSFQGRREFTYVVPAKK